MPTAMWSTEANSSPNPAYSSKVKVVQTVQAEMFQAGQTAMQNVLTTNPNVKLVLAYAGDGGMGASRLSWMSMPRDRASALLRT